jgi:hypothetical protein
MQLKGIAKRAGRKITPDKGRLKKTGKSMNYLKNK